MKLKPPACETFTSTYSHVYNGFHAINTVNWHEGVDANCFVLFLKRKLCLNFFFFFYRNIINASIQNKNRMMALALNTETVVIREGREVLVTLYRNLHLSLSRQHSSVSGSF